MTTTPKTESGNTYWQTDVQTPKDAVRCVVHLYLGAVEKELASPKSAFSVHQRTIICKPIPDDMKEQVLAALCARDAASRFSNHLIAADLTQTMQIETAPKDQDKMEGVAECCDVWAWWHRG